MARSIFTSFQMVRNIGAIDGNKVATPNRWEEIKRQGDDAIKRWIADNMSGKSCVIVLIGSKTAGRKWINFEIKKAWEDNRGLFGIHIHKLKDRNGQQGSKGANPFAEFNVGDKNMSKLVDVYDPPRDTSDGTYRYIADNIEGWIEKAVNKR